MDAPAGMDALRDLNSTPSPADTDAARPAGGEAAAGSIPSRDPAAVPTLQRLTADPFGLTALGGNAALRVFSRDGVRVVRLQLHGQAVDLACDDDARDALVALLARAPR